MAKKKQSEEGSVVAYFSIQPLEQAEALLAIVIGLMRRRRNSPSGTALTLETTVKTKDGGTIVRIFPPDSTAKAEKH